MDIKISGPDDEKKREYKTLIHAKTISSCNQKWKSKNWGKEESKKWESEYAGFQRSSLLK